MRFIPSGRIGAAGRCRPRLESPESRIALSTFAFGAITEFPGQLPPLSVAPAVANQTGFATVQIHRAGHGSDSNSKEQVQLTATYGPAQAGVGDSPATLSRSLTFKAGESKKTVIVPILSASNADGQESVNLTLSANNGSTSAAVLWNDQFTAPVQSIAGAPIVEGINPVVKHQRIVQLAVTFNKPMDVLSAENAANYWAQQETTGDLTGNTDGTLSFRSASYDAATQTVTLTPDKPFKTSVVYNLWPPTSSSNLVDTEGNSANVSTTEFGVGRTLTYAYMPIGCMCSPDWHNVSMSLSGPGTMVIDNSVIYLVGAESAQSHVTGMNSLPYDGTLAVVSSDGAMPRRDAATDH
jgi:hypothetical protein